MILVLLGPPGSGKGTQAKKLTQERNWPQLSTGDMLRAAIAKGSALGVAAKAQMDQGRLVPDEVVIGLIQERTAEADCQSGFILDGFPRTVPQAQALDAMLAKRGKHVDEAVLFDIPDSELVSRLSGRRTCLKCGAMFHIQAVKPQKDGICDQCGSLLVQRDDDKVEVIQKRLAVYHEQTAPVASYYNAQKKLRTLDARKPTAEVAMTLTQALKL